MISGLCHTHLIQYEEHGGTAAPSDFGVEVSERLKNSGMLYVVLEQGSKETAETDTEGEKARAELELVYKGRGWSTSSCKILTGYLLTIRNHKFTYGVVRKSPVCLITNAASFRSLEVLKLHIDPAQHCLGMRAVSVTSWIIIDAEKQYLTSTVKICLNPSVWLSLKKKKKDVNVDKE